MENKKNMTLRMEPSLKKDAAELFRGIGLDLSTATGMFYRQALRCKGLPFDVKSPDVPVTASPEFQTSVAEKAPLYGSYKKASPKKALPKIMTGLPDFEEIRSSGNAVYVDKTSYIHRMLECGDKFFFVSRPRRFGKSLMCSTLEALFLGRRDLFDGLFISRTGYEFQAHPVIRFDFSCLRPDSYDEFMAGFTKALGRAGKKYGIELSSGKPYSMMEDLLDGLSLKFPEKPVIIIDEFDSPVISLISSGKPDLADAIRKEFASFYRVLKSYTRSIRFLFITGCTPFSGLDMFSAMNNLNDLSQKEEFAAMFGYTEEELSRYFSAHIAAKTKAGKEGERYPDTKAFLAALRNYYDGYRFSPFSDIHVYNPVSIGSYFSTVTLDFQNFWIKTGLSTLAVTLAKNANLLGLTENFPKIDINTLASFDITGILSSDVLSRNFTAGDVPSPDAVALLYYSGYLTISSLTEQTLTLRFPNTEVRSTFLSSLLSRYAEGRKEPSSMVSIAVSAAGSGDYQSLVSAINEYYRLFNYEDLKGSKELMVRGLFKGFFGMMSLPVFTEVPAGLGRIDSVMLTPKHNYVFEFKVDGSSSSDGMKQIIERNYARLFTADQRPVHLIALDFRTSASQIVSYTHGLHGSDPKQFKSFKLSND